MTPDTFCVPRLHDVRRIDVLGPWIASACEVRSLARTFGTCGCLGRHVLDDLSCNCLFLVTFLELVICFGLGLDDRGHEYKPVFVRALNL